MNEQLKQLEQELYEQTGLTLLDIGIIKKPQILKRAIDVCGGDDCISEIIDYLQPVIQLKNNVTVFIEKETKIGKQLFEFTKNDIPELDKRLSAKGVL